jgi:hypothetical protein
MQDEFKFLRDRKRISCIRFSAFSTFFGRGLQVKMEVPNEGKYMKRKEVRI